MPHTPGPWTVDPQWPVSIKDANGKIVVSDPTGSKSAKENYANARLIAAAPDILYALQAFVDYYEQAGIGPCEDGHDDDEDNHTFDGDERFNVRQARAAIAKLQTDQQQP